MAWKRKEKDLTQEQVIDLAKQELAPHWYNAAFPLLAGLEEAGTLSAHPLDPHFRDSTWIVFSVDPFSNEGLFAIRLAKEWAARYEAHGIRCLLAFPEETDVFTDRSGVEGFLDREGITMPTFVDREGLVSLALGVNSLPTLAFLTGAGVSFVRTGPRWFEGLELELQAHLRKKDPGLSLPLPFELLDAPRDLRRCDFGSQPKRILPHSVDPANRPMEIGLGGEWKHEASYILTHDPQAELSFDIGSSGFSLMARSMSKVLERARILVEFNGAPVFDVFGWDDLTFDDMGRSLVEVRDARLYRVARNLKEPGKVILRFPNAANLPMALYSLFIS